MYKKIVSLLSLSIILISCSQNKTNPDFASDIKILNNIEDISILQDGDAMIAVSGLCQGRVFTSSSKGTDGLSYGYFNRDIIKEGNALTKLSAIGGEGRMWFGPEIGKYAIFFDPDKEQIVPNIKISPQLNTQAFLELERTEHSITYGNKMEIRNANHFIFKLDAQRKITLKTRDTIKKDLSINLDKNISHVAFSIESQIKNLNQEQWTKEKGLLSIWDISCIIPSPKSMVIIPCRNNIKAATTYFTNLNDERIQVKNGTVFYKADAQYMNKIGIQPEFCTNTFGSYSPEFNLLTIVKYNFEDDSIYVNSLWNHQEPYKGDVINVFNGEVNPAEDRNWPFYELETSSSSKELMPNDSLYHSHTVYHFEGNKEALSKISKDVLGVSLNDIPLQ
ncbi:DUF6786 family protein [Labilibacter marinus]|uniref:DUF6786 family protein n=1 Tax=Labilibacter marinus TaxID=1477105 RepID=UPI00083022BF|nr:DUF6786 family protein [Labilibacter marinus]